MARALKWLLTVGFHEPVDRPYTFVFSRAPLQSAHFFEALYVDVEEIYFM